MLGLVPPTQPNKHCKHICEVQFAHMYSDTSQQDLNAFSEGVRGTPCRAHFRLWWLQGFGGQELDKGGEAFVKCWYALVHACIKTEMRVALRDVCGNQMPLFIEVYPGSM